MKIPDKPLKISTSGIMSLLLVYLMGVGHISAWWIILAAVLFVMDLGHTTTVFTVRSTKQERAPEGWIPHSKKPTSPPKTK